MCEETASIYFFLSFQNLSELLKIEEALGIHMFEQFKMFGASDESLMRDLSDDRLLLDHANSYGIILPLARFKSFRSTDSGNAVRQADP